MTNQPVSKQQVLKDLATNKAIQTTYSKLATQWFKSQGAATPSHVVLYVDNTYSKLFVALIAKPPVTIGFVINLTGGASQHSEIRQYTMQKTKALKTYIMADSTKFELSGIFKAPVLKENNQERQGVRPSSRSTLYESIASTEVVNEETGVKFHVNIEMRLNKSDPEAVVAIYDARHGVERNNVGQFVSSYYVTTLRNHQGGLNLHGDIPAWQLSARNCHHIQEWLRVIF